MAATRRTRVIWRPRDWRYARCACRVKDWRLRGTRAHAPRAPLLACLDDDCVPAADWRERIAAALAKSPEALVGGRTFDAVKSSLYTEASQALLDYMYRHSNRDPRRPRLLIGSNLAMSRAAFERVGGFDPGFPVAAGEDRDLCERWLASGRPLLWLEDAIVIAPWDCPISWRSTCATGAAAATTTVPAGGASDGRPCQAGAFTRAC